MIVYNPLHREVAQAPTSPQPCLETLLGSCRVAWGSFGSDWLLVVRPTRAGSGADPHLSPTEAPSLGWLGSGQMHDREELWETCGCLSHRPAWGVWVTWGEWLLVGRGSILLVMV